MDNPELLVQNMEYLLCPVDQHREELSMVCLEKRCSKSLLICPICESEKHEGHEVIPLKQYLS